MDDLLLVQIAQSQRRLPHDKQPLRQVELGHQRAEICPGHKLHDQERR